MCKDFLNQKNKIIIIDFGSQYSQLIARRIRELKVYTEIRSCRTPIKEIIEENPKAIILSGGPGTIYDTGPKIDQSLFESGIPILGICYGMQLIAHSLGGKVHWGKKREYGRTDIHINITKGIFKNIPENLTVWMSHGDIVEKAPPGFKILAYSDAVPVIAVGTDSIYGVQFHPEVSHTQKGKKILANFLFSVAGLEKSWDLTKFIEKKIAEIKEEVGSKKVMCGLSGGVDSATAAMLVGKAVGDKLHTIFIDNGLLRSGEIEEVKENFEGLNNFHFIDAKKKFLNRLTGIVDPEKKRKIIGETFVEVFQRKAKKIKNIKYLVQGTLYPDVIESGIGIGPASVIKSHHNVGGLPKKMGLKLIEPFRYLFKDEVRKVAQKLGINESTINRKPFPGPGLAVRIMGAITEEKLTMLRKADQILIEEARKEKIYKDLWQIFAVLIPVQSVGVMGDKRSYGKTIVIRAVNSEDGMTADWAKLPNSLLGRAARRITNEINGIVRVLYDLSTKPPATIEWE